MNILSEFPITIEAHRAFLEARLDWTFHPASPDMCMLQAHLECELGYDVCSLPASDQAVIIDDDLQSYRLAIPPFFVAYQHAAWDYCGKDGFVTGKDALDILNDLAGIRTIDPALV